MSKSDTLTHTSNFFVLLQKLKRFKCRLGQRKSAIKNMTTEGKRKFFLPESEIGRHQIKLQLHSVASYKGER